MSNHPVYTELLERMREPLLERRPVLHELEARLSVDRYTSAARLERERSQLFGRLPLIAGHSSQVAEPGSVLTHDASGVPVVIVRGHDGVLRGFLNACRHRATRLVDGPATCARALVCPYHAWTYDLTGALTHVPHEQAFPSLDRSTRGLVQVPVAEHAGLVWLSLDRSAGELDVPGYLGDVTGDLESLELAGHHVYRQFFSTHRANWKLVIDLFLEGYHLRFLHGKSVYPYFADAANAIDRARPHIRALSARRRAQSPWSGAELRELATPSYLVFPNSLFVVHPDFVSHMAVFPESIDRVRWVHTMMIPALPTTDAERDHWETNVNLIEGTVFQKEDLPTAEAMQRGLDAGANDDLVIGRLESAIAWFHEDVDELIL